MENTTLSPSKNNRLRHFQNLLSLSALTLMITVWATVFFLKYQNNLMRAYTQGFKTSKGSNVQIRNQPETENWQTYANNNYGFESKYHPDSPPTETEGSNEAGQFTYLFLINFSSGGSNPMHGLFGYSIAIKQHSIEDTKLELVGHVTDRIDSEKKLTINGNEWTLLNYQLFVTTQDIPVTTAHIRKNEVSYEITAGRSEITQILSTFRFTDQPEAPADGDEFIDKETPTPLLAPIQTQTPSDKCLISGCNGEICAEEEMVSVCVYKEEFACYKSAVCEVQENGECGWTMNNGLKACLEKFNE